MYGKVRVRVWCACVWECVQVCVWCTYVCAWARECLTCECLMCLDQCTKDHLRVLVENSFDLPDPPKGSRGPPGSVDYIAGLQITFIIIL